MPIYYIKLSNVAIHSQKKIVIKAQRETVISSSGVFALAALFVVEVEAGAAEVELPEPEVIVFETERVELEPAALGPTPAVLELELAVPEPEFEALKLATALDSTGEPVEKVGLIVVTCESGTVIVTDPEGTTSDTGTKAGTKVVE